MTPTVRSLARPLYAIVIVIAGVGCLVVGASLVFGDPPMWARVIAVVVMVGSFLVYRVSYRVGNRPFGSPTGGR